MNSLVAIVGRANVGKSSLFNVLLGEQHAIVANEAGTTRDTVYANLTHNDKNFTLADTAGLKLDPADDFEASIQDQITEATQSADLIVVMVDASTIPTEEDRRVAKQALKSKKPVLLTVNKIDKTRQLSDEWKKLGIKDITPTSTTQKIGILEVLDWISSKITKGKAEPETDITIGLIGRPNVGKSSLFNTLGNKQQALVSSVSGTTRDINKVNIKYHRKNLALLDTAGIRRPGRIERGVEHFSFLRSIKAIEQSDICLLLIDANEPATHLEQKLAGIIKAAGKCLIVVISKWDSVDKDSFTADQLAMKIHADFQHVWWAPLIFTSAVTGQNVTKLYELILDVYKNANKTLKTSELNRMLQDAIAEHPPSGLKNRRPKLRYIVQSDTKPPAFRIYGDKVSYLHWSYKRRLEKLIRGMAEFNGTPIALYFSDKEPRK